MNVWLFAQTAHIALTNPKVTLYLISLIETNFLVGAKLIGNQSYSESEPTVGVEIKSAGNISTRLKFKPEDYEKYPPNNLYRKK